MIYFLTNSNASYKALRLKRDTFKRCYRAECGWTSSYFWNDGRMNTVLFQKLTSGYLWRIKMQCNDSIGITNTNTGVNNCIDSSQHLISLSVIKVKVVITKSPDKARWWKESVLDIWLPSTVTHVSSREGFLDMVDFNTGE